MIWKKKDVTIVLICKIATLRGLGMLTIGSWQKIVMNLKQRAKLKVNDMDLWILNWWTEMSGRSVVRI